MRWNFSMRINYGSRGQYKKKKFFAENLIIYDNNTEFHPRFSGFGSGYDCNAMWISFIAVLKFGFKLKIAWILCRMAKLKLGLSADSLSKNSYN